MSGLIRSDTAGQVTTITLDSSANRNALSAALISELHAAFSVALVDPATRVIVLTGTGPVFCSGADLKESRQRPVAAATVYPQLLQLIWEGAKPVVCRVNGSARAGGIGLIAACDIAVGVGPATFAFTEVRIGVAAAIIAVMCLRRMPARAASEYFLTGQSFGADRAAEIGLLTAVVSEADLDAETERYVGLLRRGAPGAMAATKEILRVVPGLPVDEGLAAMGVLSADLFESAEAQEGMAAFAAKRDPSWATGE
jgi:methylglutaconyl-CoA hydratase